MTDILNYIATIESYLEDEPLAWDSFSLAVVVAPTTSPLKISGALDLVPLHGRDSRVSFERLGDLALSEERRETNGGPAWLIEQESLVALLQPNDFVAGHAVTVELATGQPALAVHRNEAKAFNSLSVRPSRGRDAMYFELDELMELGVPPTKSPTSPQRSVQLSRACRRRSAGRRSSSRRAWQSSPS